MTKRAAHYTARVANDICTQIALGKTLKQALEIVGWLAPTMTTVWRWLDEHQDFREKYERARQMQADVHADDMLEMASQVLDVKGLGTVPSRYKVAADILKWQAEIRNRERYGAKNTDSGKDKHLDPAKIKAEIKRLEAELGVAESKVVPIKAVK